MKCCLSAIVCMKYQQDKNTCMLHPIAKYAHTYIALRIIIIIIILFMLMCWYYYCIHSYVHAYNIKIATYCVIGQSHIIIQVLCF